MEPIDDLFEAVNNHYHKFGEYPEVCVSREFWEEHASEIAKLDSDGIVIHVKETEMFRSFYLINTTLEEQHIDTVNDLYEIAKKLKEEGKGSWPVRNMPPDTSVYLPIQLEPVIPHVDKENEVERFAAIAGDPLREFVLVTIGDIHGRTKSKKKS